MKIINTYYFSFMALLFSSSVISAQDGAAVWHADFEENVCSGPNRFTYNCIDTGECQVLNHEEWCIINPDRALAEGVEPSPDSGYMYAGYITSEDSESHRAYPCLDLNGIFSDPDGIELPIVNQWWVWFDDEDENWNVNSWHHFLTLADKNWNVVTMSMASYSNGIKEMHIAHTGTVWAAPRAERTMPQKEWVLFTVYIDSDFTHDTGEEGLLVAWMNGKKIIIGGGYFDGGSKNNLGNMGDLLVKAHWGVYGHKWLTKGRQYNDGIGIWKAADFDTVPPSPPANFSVSNITQNNCQLSWDASPDSMLLAYEIYMDTALIFTSATNTSASITGLHCDSTYQFTLFAKDIGHNLSEPVFLNVTTDSCPFVPPPTWTLTVNNGTGSGSYPEGTSITITADLEPVDCKKSTDCDARFVWTGDTKYLADTNEWTTTVTMPAKNIQVEARWADILNTREIPSGFVKIYPNPASEMVNIVANKPFSSIRIVNLSGKTCLQSNTKGTNAMLNVNHFPAGAYFLKITFEDKTRAVSKIFIQ